MAVVLIEPVQHFQWVTKAESLVQTVCLWLVQVNLHQNTQHHRELSGAIACMAMLHITSVGQTFFQCSYGTWRSDGLTSHRQGTCPSLSISAGLVTSTEVLHFH